MSVVSSPVAVAAGLFAIRARHAPGFNRGGTRFSNEHWLLVVNPTEAQLNEPNLICIDTERADFSKQVAWLPIVNPELLAETVPAAEFTGESTDAFTEHIVRSMASASRVLNMENCDLRIALTRANEQIVELTAALDAARAIAAPVPVAADGMVVTINADTTPLVAAIEKAVAQLTEAAPDDALVTSETASETGAKSDKTETSEQTSLDTSPDASAEATTEAGTPSARRGGRTHAAVAADAATGAAQ